MSGAVPLSTVGVGYLIIDPKELDVTIKETLGHYHVCIRRSKTWKEIIADVADYRNAMALVTAIVAIK